MAPQAPLDSDPLGMGRWFFSQLPWWWFWLLLTFEEPCGTLGVTERRWGTVSLVFTPPTRPSANGALGKPCSM